ncbi:ABC transporter family protein [Clostridioides difficile CD212]|nr:amino acid ABC transporter ATP-binding protein [Clostridioides difficile]EQF77034.1 ABC transporter family protein [Clostridioides difficile CD212]
MITIKNLSKSFGDLNVLKNIDLEIAKGEIMVIVGPSGSGKSTLLRCMNLLEIPTGGEIIFEGKNLVDKKTNIDEVRQNIGMVFQNFNLFPHKTILDNITLAPIKLKKMTKEEAEKKAEILLSRVGLLDKKDSYPSQLSGGQKQRIAIARALAMEPDMMLLMSQHLLLTQKW